MDIKQEHKKTLGQQALQAFRRDLPTLMKEHPGKWVAYHGDRRVGIADTNLELYQLCDRQGIPDDDYIVAPIDWEPPYEVDSPYPFD